MASREEVSDMASGEEGLEMALHFCNSCGQRIPERKKIEDLESFLLEFEESSSGEFSGFDVLYPTESEEMLNYCESIVDIAINYYNADHVSFYRVVDLIKVTASNGTYLTLKFIARGSATSGNVTFEACVRDPNRRGDRETFVESVDIVADEAETPQVVTSQFAAKRAPTLSGGVWDLLL